LLEDLPDWPDALRTNFIDSCIAATSRHHFMSAEIPKLIQLYDLSTNRVVVEMPLYSDIEFMEGDEIEGPTIGTFKIVRRRWSISGESIILVLQLEPLA
jgi:hypothetical protein